MYEIKCVDDDVMNVCVEATTMNEDYEIHNKFHHHDVRAVIIPNHMIDREYIYIIYHPYYDNVRDGKEDKSKYIQREIVECV